MKKFFYGADKRGPYFEGWYFKCQTKAGQSIALIPALHIDGAGKRSASIQVITDSGSWWLEYPGTDFSASQERFCVQIGANIFSEAGMLLNIARDGFSLRGSLSFGPFRPLKSDIMGPFRFLDDMECSHGVISMGHSLRGQLVLNGIMLDLDGGTGYVETDRGHSFPTAYLWTQCVWEKCSLMLSIAAIPLGRIRFTGCICAIVHDGREYRLATYRGVKVEKWSCRGAVIRQGKYRLEVELLEEQDHPLRAPENGTMGRKIHESLRAKLRYRFWTEDKLLFDHTDPGGSFEFVK